MPDAHQNYPDYTQLACLERCEREYAYRYLQHLGSARPDASAWFGQRVHEGVRLLYEALGSADALGAMLGPSALGSAPQDERKPHLTLGYAHDVCALYRELYFPLAEWELVLNERYLESARLGYCGIVDRVVRWKGDGRLYVSDLKTTGLYVSDAWLAQFAHSAQMVGYLDLAEEALGEPLAGVWVDAIHVNRKGKPERKDFIRHGPLEYPLGLRDELRCERAERSARAALLRSAPHEARKSTTQCFRFNALCAFYRYCRAEPADRADMLKLAQLTGELVESKWEPANVAR